MDAEVVAADIRWEAFPEPLDWLLGVAEEDGLAGIVARLVIVRHAQGDVISAALAELQQQRGEMQRQRATIGRLHEERRKVVQKADEPDVIELVGGTRVRLRALRAALAVEHRGADLFIDADGDLSLRSGDRLPPEWIPALRAMKAELLEIVRYRSPELPQ